MPYEFFGVHVMGGVAVTTRIVFYGSEFSLSTACTVVMLPSSGRLCLWGRWGGMNQNITPWMVLGYLTPDNCHTSRLRQHTPQSAPTWLDLWCSVPVCVTVTGWSRGVVGNSRVPIDVVDLPENIPPSSALPFNNLNVSSSNNTFSEGFRWYTPCRVDKIVRVRNEARVDAEVIAELEPNEVRAGVRVVEVEGGDKFVEGAEGGYSRLQGPGGEFLAVEPKLHP